MAAPANGSQNNLDSYIVSFINNQLNGDLRELAKLKTIHTDQKRRKEYLETKLSVASIEVPSEIDKAIKNAEETKRHIQKVGNDKDALCHDILDRTRELQTVVKELEILSQQVQSLEKYVKYLSTLARIEDFSSQIQAALLTESMRTAVDTFNDLAILYEAIQGSVCSSLVCYTKDTIIFWNKLLRDKIAMEFGEILKALRWPLVSTTMKQPSVTNITETNTKMEELFKQLLHLHIPDAISIESQVAHPVLLRMVGLKPLLLPMHLMLLPLRKRFKFHFYGSKQTNSLDKPEWYFAQVLGWIRDHSDFLETKVQPILDQTGHKTVNAKVELMRGLVMLVIEKMATDLPELMYDEHLFSHLIDEALLFDRELRNTYDYPSDYFGCLHVLTDSEAFDKWLQIERKFAVEKVDAMLSSPSAWLSQYKDISDADELKVPECGESFMTLLLTITDRYKYLPNPESKLRFLSLQLELLEDFRIRSVQVMKEETHNPIGQRFCSILNTIHYVTEVLREWTELPFFLQLQYSKLHHNKRKMGEEKSEDKAAMETTVFDDIMELFESMKSDMIKNILNYVFVDFQARSQPYRKDRWISLSSDRELRCSLGLSVSACEMLMVLKDHLAVMNEQLSKPLFTRLWQKLAYKIDKFILEDVVLVNHFNDGGALQFQFDMTRNLFPLFGEYTQKPENYFRSAKEACTLLTLKAGSAILLKDLLHAVLHKSKTDPNEQLPEPRSALHDVGVFKLTLQQAETILSLRVKLGTT